MSVTAVHYAPVDPGLRWVKDPGVRIDVPQELGHWKALTPDVVAVEGGLRMYYTLVGPGTDYDVTPGRILSAFSVDGERWEPEPGVRVEPFGPHADLRVVCPDVVPLDGGGYRMYLEGQPRGRPANIVSARSEDGLNWTPEAGVRYGDRVNRLGSPRVLDTGVTPGARGRWRLYFHRYPLPLRMGLDAGNHILSAVSADGLAFDLEAGVRIPQGGDLETFAVYAAEALRLGTGGYRMYYAGWTADPVRGRIFAARSEDGVTWTKEGGPLLEPGGRGAFDAEKCSEPSVIRLPDGRFCMFYEACDENQVWRILSATAE
ncbi:MAG: hypothetical protein FJ038_13325 [Chloroflexi bacterium]|nr:hypothetical protein [Chloroflexota bacterium]